jgi:hypothetical protein
MRASSARGYAPNSLSAGETLQRQSLRLAHYLVPLPATTHSHALPSAHARASETLERARNIGPHNRHIPDETRNCGEEVAEQDHDAVQLDNEADKGPAGEDQHDTCGEGEGAFPLLAAREEGEGFCCADDESQANEEEDLGSTLGRRGGSAFGRGERVPGARGVGTLPIASLLTVR